MAQVPDVAVAAVDIFLALLDGNIVLLRVDDGVFARINVPLAPGGDDGDVRSDGFVCQFEAHLVVAFAGAAVGEAIRAKFQGDFGLALGNDRTRHRRTKQVSVFVDGARAQRRPDVMANKFFLQVFDIGRRCTGSESFLARGFQVLLLAHVANHGDDFAAVIFLEPRNDNGGVEAPRISEYDFFRFVLLRFHNSSLTNNGCQARAQPCWAPQESPMRTVRVHRRVRTECTEWLSAHTCGFRIGRAPPIAGRPGPPG